MENQNNKNQVQKGTQEAIALRLGSQMNLINALETGNKTQMAVILKQYKLPDGSHNFPALFNIPSDERIPVIAAKDLRRAIMLITGALTMALKSVDMKQPPNEIQILDIAEAIVDTSSEDNLGIEDVVLFLQGFVRGKYGVFEKINTPKFIQIFEQYRQERHEAVLRYREENHLCLKKLGDNGRTSQSDPLSEHFASFGDKISQLKDDLKYANNRHLKDIDNF